MNSLPIIGILILMLLVVSGYVSSEETPVTAESTARHVDPHLNYYAEHLITMGIERRRP